MAEVKKQKKMPRKKATKRQKMDWFAAYVFIAPVTIGLFAFYLHLALFPESLVQL